MIDRRSFFRTISGSFAGLCLGVKVFASPDKLWPGQVWWDKDCCWTNGWQEAKKIGILLSADEETFWDGERVLLWKVAEFDWCSDDYMGAHIRKFTEGEVRKMYLIGNISQIKDFRTKEEK